MKTMAVADFKTHFSEVLDEVRNGEEFQILYGRSKKPVAKLIPLETSPRKCLLGALQGKAQFVIGDDWKMSAEELSNL